MQIPIPVYLFPKGELRLRDAKVRLAAGPVGVSDPPLRSQPLHRQQGKLLQVLKRRKKFSGGGTGEVDL